MGILDKIFGSGGSGISGACTQIVSDYSQNDEKNENEYELSGDTRHSCPKCHSIPSTEIPKAVTQPLPRCGYCQHFTRDRINPESGLGTCQAFFLPDGKRQVGRYPMQDPKTETCFEKEANRETGD